MKFNFLRKTDHTVYVACSGGMDSVALLHALFKQKKDVTIAFYHHGNQFADIELDFVMKLSKQFQLPLLIDTCTDTVVGSKEQFWRDSRYRFFHTIPGEVVTGHNLNDAAEWYLMTCLRGEGHYIPFRRYNVIRPLLTTTRETIEKYCKHHALEWLEDPTNADEAFTERNKIRHTVLPVCLEANPGLLSRVKRRIEEKTSKEEGGSIPAA